MKPLFSFIIPTFNRADIICEALESVRLEQKASHFSVEVLVADDFSTDNTEQVVKRWCEQKNISWVFYEKLPKKLGVCAARNNGVNRAQGEYLVFLDSDDQIIPNSLKHINVIFELHKNIDLYYGAIKKKSGSLGVLPNALFLETPLDYQQYVSLSGLGEYLQICKRSLLNNPERRFCEQLNGFETFLWMQTLREGAKLWIDPRPVRLYDDLRTDRLCHPDNLAKDSSRLAPGFLLFFQEFGESIQAIAPAYWAALLLRTVFYHKVAKLWNDDLHQQLKPQLAKAPLKVKLIAGLPSAWIGLSYPLLNRFRNAKFIYSWK